MSKTLQTKIEKLEAELAALKHEADVLRAYETEAVELRKIWEPRGYVLLRKEKDYHDKKPRVKKAHPPEKPAFTPVVDDLAAKLAARAVSE
jgi:hypothetical protein